jgi:phosphoribosylpyrophosphate synthetase
VIKLNKIPVNVTMFPDNTSQVWKVEGAELDNLNVIEWEFDHEGELFHLVQLVDLLRDYGINDIGLTVPFLPYGRQDKDISNESTFALRSFAKVINRLHLNFVETLDAHSLVGKECIEGFWSRSPSEYILKTISHLGDVTAICYPDKGAFDRYSKMLPEWDNCFVCEKVRDQKTGEITGMEWVRRAKSLEGNVLIIDDICDGGRTFTEAALKLLYNGIDKVYLYTTHGIYSRGLQVLKQKGIERIFTHKGEAHEHEFAISYRRI